LRHGRARVPIIWYFRGYRSDTNPPKNHALRIAQLRTLAARLPSAVRADFGRCAIVHFLLPARTAFFMFRFAARLCFIAAMAVSLSFVSAGISH